jgi:hypothetical protein
VRNIVENYIYGKNCIYATGFNNITEYLVIITEIEGVKAKALLDLRYIRNYINPK